MTLRRFLEMVRGKFTGADDWPVFFASYRQETDGAWRETDSANPNTSVEVCHDEVLLIRDFARAPLSVFDLVSQLSPLAEQHGDADVDTCEPPIVTEELGKVHIDLPVMGIGTDEDGKRLLVVFASKAESS